MKFRVSPWLLTLAALASMRIIPAGAQSVYYSQNFDVDDTANWTLNEGPTDELADFFFDYSTVGIPAAPNSNATTRGMKLQANRTDGVFGGMSVSPNDKAFTGDYSLTFDWWANYVGPADVGNSGSTMLSLFGLDTTGTFSNWPGNADAVYFAGTVDGGSTADWRVYSPERVVSYQLPVDPAVLDGLGEPVDAHANYLAGSRNNSAALYATAFPGGATVPTAQTTAYPDTQTGTTIAGQNGFVWNAVEIRKVGNVYRFFANGVELLNVDMTNAVTLAAGENILFGHSDTNPGIPLTDPPYSAYAELTFTLIDNIKVTEFIAGPTIDADFDGENGVDGADLLIWQQNFEIADGTALNADGDANGDGNVTAADLDAWVAHFGLPQSVGSIGVVPEPNAAVLASLAVAALVARRRGARVER